MKLNFFMALSIILTIIYLITFSGYSAGFHAISIIMLFVFYLFTGKIAADESKVDSKFRILINGMIICMLILPIFIAPDQFDSSLKIFRGISALFILYDAFKKTT